MSDAFFAPTKATHLYVSSDAVKLKALGNNDVASEKLLELLYEYAAKLDQYKAEQDVSSETPTASELGMVWNLTDFCTFTVTTNEETAEESGDFIVDSSFIPDASMTSRGGYDVQDPLDATLSQTKRVKVIDLFRPAVIDWSSPETYTDALEEECKRIFKIMASIDFTGWKPQWKLKTSKNGAKVFGATIPGSPWAAVRSNAIVEGVTPKQLRDFLVNDDNVSLYDNNFDTYEVIARTSKFVVKRYKYKAIFPTNPRDFLLVTVSEDLGDDGFYVCSISADDSLCPLDPSSHYVRAKLMCSGAIIRPVKGGSDLTFIAHSDLGGAVPTSVLNLVQYSMPVRSLVAIQEHFRR